MRITSFFVGLIFSTANLFGQVTPISQDTTGIIQMDTTAVVPGYIPEEPYKAPVPSSLAELLYRTQQGEFDPVRVIGETADQGIPIVDSLQTILWGEPESVAYTVSSDPTTEGDSVQVPTGIDTVGLRRMRVYSLFALEAMNKVEAYTLLTEIAASHSDAELRGIALHALGISMHEQIAAESQAPAKELVYLLLQSANDTARVEYFSTTIREIAGQGLNNWIGMDFGAAGDPQRIIRVEEEQTEMTMNQYRLWWWEQNNDRLKWDSGKKVFELTDGN